MPADGFVEPVTWHARQPGVVLSAAAVIGDGHGRVLLVKPNYRELWSLPGGICEFREPPHEGCAREVTEELGLTFTPGRLLSVDWRISLPMYGPQARPVGFFLFDGGTLDSLDGIRLQPEELDDCRFVPESDLEAYLPPGSPERLRAALAARGWAGACYVPTGWPPPGPA